MKKLLAIAAMSAVASLGSTSINAQSWDVKCFQQGPARGFVAGFLKPGNTARPLRSLDVNNNLALPNTTGYPIGARSISTKAEVAEKSDTPNDMNFAALGFGGTMTLEYLGGSGYFLNGGGSAVADIDLFETTWGNPSCRPNISETATVEFSADGFLWKKGSPVDACHNGSFDISPLQYAKYVRITDKTNPDWKVTGDGVDAYDVDGLEAKFDGDPSVTPGVCDYKQGVSKQFIGMGALPGTGIFALRNNIANAQVNDPTFTPAQLANPALREVVGTYNFWSIGFGGYACFALGYPVFAIPGPTKEIRMFETTWNNSPCPNYPESVLVQVSVDAITWSAALPLCKDGDIDLDLYGAGYDVVNYIKFTDASNPGSFGKGDDSYDIDNIYVAQAPPGENNPPLCSEVGTRTNIRQFPNVESNVGFTGVPETMFPLAIVGSNIVSDEISFSSTIGEEGGFFYSIRNHTGQELVNGELKGNLYDLSEETVSTSNLASGVYFLTLSSANTKETVKFVKK